MFQTLEIKNFFSVFQKFRVFYCKSKEGQYYTELPAEEMYNMYE